MSVTDVTHNAEIRAELARRGMTQAQLGELLGRPQQWVQRRLSGATAISVDDLHKIADCLDVDPADLIGRRSA